MGRQICVGQGSEHARCFSALARKFFDDIADKKKLVLEVTRNYDECHCMFRAAALTLKIAILVDLDTIIWIW